MLSPLAPPPRRGHPSGLRQLPSLCSPLPTLLPTLLSTLLPTLLPTLLLTLTLLLLPTLSLLLPLLRTEGVADGTLDTKSSPCISGWARRVGRLRRTAARSLVRAWLRALLSSSLASRRASTSLHVASLKLKPLQPAVLAATRAAFARAPRAYRTSVGSRWAPVWIICSMSATSSLSAARTKAHAASLHRFCRQAAAPIRHDISASSSVSKEKIDSAPPGSANSWRLLRSDCMSSPSEQMLAMQCKASHVTSSSVLSTKVTRAVSMPGKERTICPILAPLGPNEASSTATMPRSASRSPAATRWRSRTSPSACSASGSSMSMREAQRKARRHLGCERVRLSSSSLLRNGLEKKSFQNSTV